MADLELVRSIYAAWERGDYGSVDWAHPDIEFALPDLPDPGAWRGVEAMTVAWRDFLSAWSAHRVEVDEYRELDEERVLVLLRAEARGRTSGVDLRTTSSLGANLFHVRDGKVTRLVVYFSADRALADLGLAR
jgi:ketosteroid isomerase-like protein